MWKLPELESKASIPTGVDTEVVGVFQDSSKKAISNTESYSGFIERFRKNEVFKAKLGSIQFIRFAEKATSENILFVGFGGAEEVNEEKIRVAGGNAWSKLTSERCSSVLVHIDSFFGNKGSRSKLNRARVIRTFAEGLVLNAYQFNKYKSTEQDSKEPYTFPTRIIFYTKDKALKGQVEKELSEVRAIAEAVQITRDWSNEPSNYGTPEYFAGESQRLAQEYGLKCKILTEEEAAKEKMGLFLGVGQGSERESRLVVLEYVPRNVKKAKTIALVGKGVTFDSGGISIKPSARMEDMKHDMTGAATVMGAMLLAARWKVPNRVIGIMVFTENMPDGTAIQPGNVLTARNGKTVEVINTDAEGRLILADALDYAQDYKPDAIVDVATLTGAVSIALGKLCCAVLGNEKGLINSLRQAGTVNGERIWELPLFDEYFDDLKSDYADMKNSANDSYGGTIRGAIFLKQFIRKGTRWAHLDIAATAYNLGHLSYFPKRGASGAYVRTLAQFVADFSE